jgi:hypothetical protein
MQLIQQKPILYRERIDLEYSVIANKPYLVTDLLNCYIYKIGSGCFKGLLIKLGYNVLQNPVSRFYQLIEIRLSSKFFTEFYAK